MFLLVFSYSKILHSLRPPTCCEPQVCITYAGFCFILHSVTFLESSTFACHPSVFRMGCLCFHIQCVFFPELRRCPPGNYTAFLSFLVREGEKRWKSYSPRGPTLHSQHTSQSPIRALKAPPAHGKKAASTYMQESNRVGKNLALSWEHCPVSVARHGSSGNIPTPSAKEEEVMAGVALGDFPLLFQLETLERGGMWREGQGDWEGCPVICKASCLCTHSIHCQGWAAVIL